MSATILQNGPSLTGVSVPDPLDRWRALGFEITDGAVLLAGTRIDLGAPRITATIGDLTELAGLPLKPREVAPVYTTHPNGALGLDHLVALTPHFDQTISELAEAGLPLKRVRDAGGFRQGFRRLGRPILEIVETDRVQQPTWWGLTVTLPDLQTLPAELSSAPKPAVQPGRFIATATSPGVPLAFITPES